MKVFISWSGTRSHKVAEMLRDWLNLVIQSLKPWVSSSDIERGAQWNTKINRELEATTQGIFCLTAENKEAPWILFEAGSLAKGQDTSRVYTLLIDLEPADITGPLVQFNHTLPVKAQMRLLMEGMNERLGESRLPDAVLHRSFENAWPTFESDFKTILDGTPDVTPKDTRGDKDILNEILELTRNFDSRIARVESQQSNFFNTIRHSRDISEIQYDPLTGEPGFKLSLETYITKLKERNVSEEAMWPRIKEKYPEASHLEVVKVMKRVAQNWMEPPF